MAKREPFSIIFDPAVRHHLNAIEKKFHSLIRDNIHEQLTYEPMTETRNRKPLKREVDFHAKWELRFGPDNCFRVFYTVNTGVRKVEILAVGLKLGSTLCIADEETKI